MDKECFVRSFDGTELFVTSSGAGPTLLLCDGLGCDGFVWRYIKETFRDHYRIVHWNYRGHGLSQVPTDRSTLSVPAFRRDMLAVCDAMNIDKAVIMGHSMGVQLLYDFALEHPERVLGMVPMCGGYGRPLETFHDRDLGAVLFPYIRKMAHRMPRATQKFWSTASRSTLMHKIALTFELNGRLIRPGDFEPYLAHLATMDVFVFIELLNALCEHSVEDRLGDLKVPTLIVAGEKDTFTPAWLSHRMAALIPDSELLVVPSGSHCAPIEIPELVNLRVENFLTRRIAPLIAPQAAPGKSAPGKTSAKAKNTQVDARAKKKQDKPKVAAVTSGKDGHAAGMNGAGRGEHVIHLSTVERAV